MANLKNINETELLKRIDQAREQAIADIERAVEAARTDVKQVASAAKADAPGLIDLTARADVAFVAEKVFGGMYGRAPEKDAPAYRMQFRLDCDSGGQLQLGEATIKPGTYRVFFFALRIE